jgi:hypothetical protein
MADEIVLLMQQLYFTEDSARTLLIGIGYPVSRIYAFRAAATFWPEVVINLRNGVVANGVSRLLETAVTDNPGSAEARRLLATVRTAPAAQESPAATSPPSILCLLSDPTRSLRIDSEARFFQSLQDQGVKVRIVYAARANEITRWLREEKHTILHFGGHGTNDGRLLFENEKGASVTVDLGALASAIAALCDPLECVVLNSCYSARGAESFRGTTRAVVGAVAMVPDPCALSFIGGFYPVLPAGGSIRKAFEAGRAEAGLRNCETWGFHYEPFGDESR